MKRVMGVGVAAVLIAVTLGFAWWLKTSSEQTELDKNRPEQAMSQDEEKGNSKLESTDLKVGEGAEAATGKTVSVHYTGTLTDGTKFDSSVDRGTPFEFQLGAGEVIQGWDQGLVGMKVGGKRKLVIPPDMAYGSQGRPGIPPNSSLVFEVELLEVK
jgi:FKBP-type peptidyl-prolyl cis-trans isomerase FkpA